MREPTRRPIEDQRYSPRKATLFPGFFATVWLAAQAHPQVSAASFDVSPQPAGSANGEVSAIALQKDGRVLVGGDFTTLAAQRRVRLGRLHPDGEFDNSFDPGTGITGNTSSFPTRQAPVALIVPLGDGKILVGGAFSSYDGVARINLARLMNDGTRDKTFTAGLGFIPQAAFEQEDGRLVIGGFSQIRSTFRQGWIVRLNQDGTSDSAFGYPGVVQGHILALAQTSGGKILAGNIQTAGPFFPGPAIQRLNPDGSPDQSFPNAVGLGIVNSIVIQPDGKLLVGGNFESGFMLLRLSGDGDQDLSFQPVKRSGTVKTIALQADGRILIGGDFLGVNGVSRARIARLNTDGTLDATFHPGTGVGGSDTAVVKGVIPLNDGRIVVAGIFSQVDQLPKQNLVWLYERRLNNPQIQNGEFRAQIATLRGKVYTLESNDSLPMETWQSSGTVAGSGGIQSLTNSIAETPRRFYRIRVE